MDFEQRNEMTEETFGSFIKERRERAQMSIRALANLIGTSAVYLRDIEIFNRPAPRNQDVLEKLASVLGLNEGERQFMNRAALASRGEDIGDYLKDNPRVCLALRMAQELSDSEVDEEWETFIKRLKELNEQKSSDTN